jgi:parallel beta-helix repeat protein
MCVFRAPDGNCRDIVRNSGGTSGCSATIGAAVAASAANDIIIVGAGTYKEDVVIGKPLSLIGENKLTTVIDATHRANGIYVDGIDNHGLAGVTVTGFTVQDANFEGILVTNASYITIWNNRVFSNNKNLTATGCPGIPAFETLEGFDCGEGIHLTGVHI